LVQFGDLYRLKTFENDGFYSTQYVNKDKSESVLFINTNANGFFNKGFKTIALKGLDEDKIYCLTDGENEVIKSGTYFMHKTYDLRMNGPFDSKIIRIKQYER
jgi:alpha-galactosidase